MADQQTTEPAVTVNPRGKAVVDGQLLHVSASQIISAQSCPRRWWFEKVSGIEVVEPPSPALERGEAVHKQLEDWYLKCKEPEHPSAVKLIADCPVPSRTLPGLLIEHPRDYKLGLSAAGVNVKGRIDLLDTSDKHRVAIWDWKTTSDFKRNKTKSELARNVQLITYAKWAFTVYPMITDVTLSHGYVLTKMRKGRHVVDATVVTTDPLTPDVVNSAYATSVETPVKHMVEWARQSDATSVPFINEPATDTCWAWNRRCPYADQCPDYRSRSDETFWEPSVSTTAGVSAMSEDLKGRKQEANCNTSTTPNTSNMTTTTAPAGFELYVDAVPTFLEPDAGYSSITLEEYTARLHDKVCAKHKVGDIRLIEYGKGRGYLAAAVRENLPTADVVIGRSGDLTSTVAEALIPFARRVVRGVR